MEATTYHGGDDGHQHGADGDVTRHLGEDSDREAEHVDHHEAGQRSEDVQLASDPHRQTSLLSSTNCRVNV